MEESENEIMLIKSDRQWQRYRAVASNRLYANRTSAKLGIPSKGKVRPTAK